MNKKAYIQPAVAILPVSHCLPIAASDPKVGVDTTGSVDAGELDTKTSGDWNIWEE